MASYITIRPDVTTMERVLQHYTLINKDRNEAVFNDICKNPDLFRDNLICYLSGEDGHDECMVLTKKPTNYNV